jgi:inner membrane protein
VHHRGITHSLAGLAVLTVAVALACRAWPRRRGAADGASHAHGGERPGLRALLFAAALGTSSHLLLDALNSYGIRPWLPFDARWLYVDVAFVVDPLLWLGFGAAAMLGAPVREPSRTRAGTIAWAAWSLLAGAVLFAWTGPLLHGAVAALFLAGSAAALWARARRRSAGTPARPPPACGPSASSRRAACRGPGIRSRSK